MTGDEGYAQNLAKENQFVAMAFESQCAEGKKVT